VSSKSLNYTIRRTPFCSAYLKLKLFYLPPYSPQLNPDEQVWAHVKRQVSRQLVQSKDEMKRLAIGALRRIQKLPELVKSFFRQPECQYAAI
jgi:transposase